MIRDFNITLSAKEWEDKPQFCICAAKASTISHNLGEKFAKDTSDKG